ncbi:DUF4345 domain-containing protein [uncultured Algibacter sp.]|uniref:DUF4345 domain-containing protein n=1 Tax=uncultured Algibacter sp. TaxID=298659 RepID=UPI002610CFB8|nr:DUF4345 domain-containing protein [uncultured Algibacter sp.]
MIRTKQDFINKIHLIISLIVVIPVSFVYGFYPEVLVEVHLNTTDEYNIFKAIMGLYLGFAVVWLLGVFNDEYLKIALITNMVFMFGLGAGRLLSLFIDGLPSLGFVFGAVGELVLAIYGMWVLKTRD